MKKLFINGSNIILFFLISTSVLLSSCNSEEDEHKAPTAEFILNGTIIDEDSNAIENIQISESNSTYYSNQEGQFSLSKTPSNGAVTLDLSLVDIDDTVHGKFFTLDTVIEFTNLKFEGGDGKWDAGTATEEIELTMEQDTSTHP